MYYVYMHGTLAMQSKMLLSLFSASVSRSLVCRHGRRFLHSTSLCRFNKPVSGYALPRSGGIATAFRLPLQENSPQGLDACFVGIPMDCGVSNRSGTRLGKFTVFFQRVYTFLKHMS